MSMISMHIVPIVDALALNTASIEAKKDIMQIVKVIKNKELLAMEVITIEKVQSKVQYNMPILRWRGDPGVSDSPTIKAPNEISVPVMNSPNSAHTTIGMIVPMVIRRPSAKYWP